MGRVDPALAEAFGAAITERFLAPRHAGRPADPRGWFSGGAGRLAAGARVVIWLRPAGDGAGLRARFEVFGDPAVVAAADWLCERAEAGGSEALAALDGRRIGEALGLPAARLGGALLVEDAARAALAHAERA